MKWDEPDHLRLRALKALDKHLDLLNDDHEPPSAYADEPDLWVISYDSGADDVGKVFGEHHMSRTLIFDTHDDGYFVSLQAQFGLWGCEDGDEYEMDGLAMLGGDDDNFQVVPTDKEN